MLINIFQNNEKRLKALLENNVFKLKFLVRERKIYAY